MPRCGCGSGSGTPELAEHQGRLVRILLCRRKEGLNQMPGQVRALRKKIGYAVGMAEDE
jgi:hypothetical protein